MTTIWIGCWLGGCANPVPGSESPTLQPDTPVPETEIREDGDLTTATRTVFREFGATLTFPDRTQLIIPAGALPEDLEISITKDDLNSRFMLAPEGLVASGNMTLEIPLPDWMVSDHRKAIVAYIYSDESPVHETGSSAVRAERLLMTLAAEHQAGDLVQLSFGHFSLIRMNTQDALYLPFNLPSTYLQKADVLFALSAENYITQEEGFDWFPGHTGMISEPRAAVMMAACPDDPSRLCDMIESVPDVVRLANLQDQFVYVSHHINMGARRPSAFSLSDEEQSEVVAWAQDYLGTPWAMLNDFDSSSDDYDAFSCVGLIEAAYDSIGRPIVENSLWTVDTLLRPLDMYDETSPVDRVTVRVGEGLELQVNPVFLDQEKRWYLDYRNLADASGLEGFRFTATDLPDGAVIDLETGLLTWYGVPSSFGGQSVTMTFQLDMPYPGLLWGGDVISITETLTVDVAFTGNISGSVRDAATSAPVADVEIDVFDARGLLYETVTDDAGVYQIEGLISEQLVQIDIHKTGYLGEIYDNIQVPINNTLYLETILQVAEAYAGPGDVEGTIYDAVDGHGVPDLQIRFRKGINVVEGDVLAETMTDASGAYVIHGLEAGSYTGELSGEGYNTAYYTAVSLGGETNTGQDATVSPVQPEGESRVVLTWGSSPSDLDSHITGPISGDTDRFHVYFADKGNASSSPYAFLDLDDTSSYGPETVTITLQLDGTYRYSVHNYTSRSSSYSTSLSSSGAQVTLYHGNSAVTVFNVPPGDGTLWTVFELNGDTITPINMLSYASSSSSVTRSSSPIPPSGIQTDRDLLRDLPAK